MDGHRVMLYSLAAEASFVGQPTLDSSVVGPRGSTWYYRSYFRNALSNLDEALDLLARDSVRRCVKDPDLPPVANECERHGSGPLPVYHPARNIAVVKMSTDERTRITIVTLAMLQELSDIP